MENKIKEAELDEEETGRKAEEEILKRICWLNRSYYANPSFYQKYDDYDAINVDKVIDIPYDYDGLIGVPITFMDKYEPECWELIELVKPHINKKRKYARIIIRKKIKGPLRCLYRHC